MEGRLNMSAPISKVCDELIEIRDQFEDNEELFEAITSSDNAEDLLVAIGMAVAYAYMNFVMFSETKEDEVALAKEIWADMSVVVLDYIEEEE
jgi:hypothetical protein